MSERQSQLRIGLALSGGGVRAAVFHLGVLGRLAKDNLLERVTFISTVSGGSLATGLVYAAGGNRWPGSADYLSTVQPSVRGRLTRVNIQSDIVRRFLMRPWLIPQWRANLVADSIRSCWEIDGLVCDLATEPRWAINATTYETGRSWRFSPQRMGDYKLGYVLRPPVPIADALAASAAFPGLIGALVLPTSSYQWVRFKSWVEPGDRAGGTTLLEDPSLGRRCLRQPRSRALVQASRERAAR
ncbi:MAG: patatin-like phospholipase family protein [Chloroflexi bacterium]|nr:patatin-like phospholipase family protein [Chloroflexota bacterium]